MRYSLNGFLKMAMSDSRTASVPAQLPDWINALGILMSNLPEAYWDGLYDKLVSALNEPPLSQWNASGADPFKVICLIFSHMFVIRP